MPRVSLANAQLGAQVCDHGKDFVCTSCHESATDIAIPDLEIIIFRFGMSLQGLLNDIQTFYHPKVGGTYFSDNNAAG